jgi:hypothetical protein
VAFAAVVVVPRGAPEMRRSFAFVTHPRVTLATPIVSSRAQFGIVPAHRHFLFFSFLFFSFLCRLFFFRFGPDGREADRGQALSDLGSKFLREATREQHVRRGSKGTSSFYIIIVLLFAFFLVEALEDDHIFIVVIGEIEPFDNALHRFIVGIRNILQASVSNALFRSLFSCLVCLS